MNLLQLENLSDGQYVMLKDTSILSVESYVKISQKDTKDIYAIIHSIEFAKKSEFYYPFLMNIDNVVDIILSRKGFYLEIFDLPFVFPADPQYLIYVVKYRGQVVVEVIDVSDVIAKTNAEKIVTDVLKNIEELSIYEYHDIRKEFMNSIRLGGHDLGEVREILFRYYDQGERSLESEVFKIIEEYYKLFKPVRFYL